MAQLRAAAAKAGFTAVRSYIASGNIVLKSDLDGHSVENLIEETIEQEFGFPVDVVVRTDKQWAAYVDNNPLKVESESHPARVMICLGREAATDSDVAALTGRASRNERVERASDVLWLYFGDGAARTRLNTGSGFARFTTRNWTTAKRLHEMLLE